MPNWDLYRIFLAVADAGSLLTAGKRLKLSAQTVSRRVAELEDGLGLKLLARANSYARASKAWGDVASKVETAMAEAKRTPAGVVRISINEVLLLGSAAPQVQPPSTMRPRCAILTKSAAAIRNKMQSTSPHAFSGAAYPDR
jgi:DNA-binding transcriptional LysR family regulator